MPSPNVERPRWDPQPPGWQDNYVLVREGEAVKRFKGARPIAFVRAWVWWLRNA